MCIFFTESSDTYEKKNCFTFFLKHLAPNGTPFCPKSIEKLYENTKFRLI